jgi:hypothetical protein
MIQRAVVVPPDLFEEDETAWLELMAQLIQEDRLGDLDYPHLQEYLADMARRHRREVKSRLTVLLADVLKWLNQPEQRSESWRRTIVKERLELARLMQRGVLRAHAEAILSEAYADAVERAAADTEREAESFPAACPCSLGGLLGPGFVESWCAGS